VSRAGLSVRSKARNDECRVTRLPPGCWRGAIHGLGGSKTVSLVCVCWSLLCVFSVYVLCIFCSDAVPFVRRLYLLSRDCIFCPETVSFAPRLYLLPRDCVFCPETVSFFSGTVSRLYHLSRDWIRYSRRLYHLHHLYRLHHFYHLHRLHYLHRLHRLYHLHRLHRLHHCIICIVCIICIISPHHAVSLVPPRLCGTISPTVSSCALSVHLVPETTLDRVGIVPRS
jgi:hypothetical protein